MQIPTNRFLQSAIVLALVFSTVILPPAGRDGVGFAQMGDDPPSCECTDGCDLPPAPEPFAPALAPAAVTTAPAGPTFPPVPSCTPAAAGTKPMPGADCNQQKVELKCVQSKNGGGGACTENDKNRTCKVTIAVKTPSTCTALGLDGLGPISWAEARDKFKKLLSDLAAASDDFELLRSICTGGHELTHCYDSCRGPCTRVCDLEQSGDSNSFACLRTIFDAKRCPMPSTEGICKKLAQSIVEANILRDVNKCACKVDDANSKNPKENQEKCVAECINGKEGCVELALKRGFPPRNCIVDFCTNAAYAFCPQYQRLAGCD